MADDEKDELVLDSQIKDFDLHRYIKDYQGRTKTERLLFIAGKCPALAAQAVQLAVSELEKQKNVNNAWMLDRKHYREIYEAAGKVLPNAPKINMDWLQKAEHVSSTHKVKLDDEIQRWRNLSNRDKTRTAYLNAAAYLSRLGLYDQAVQKLAEARDFCSTQTELNECHMEIMKASIRQGSLSHVHTESDRLLLSVSTPGIVVSPQRLSRAHAMAALYHLQHESFQVVVHHLTGATHIGKFGEVMTRRDVGVYGALCGMAALKRTQLKSQILDNPMFFKCLELEPRILKAVRAMTSAKYRELMQILQAVTPDLKLDVYLSKVLKELMTAIRATALVQYFQPYSSMDLTRMAKDFGFTLAEIEEELYQAILRGRIQAKIDLADHILVEFNEQTDRQTVVEKIVTEGELFCREAMNVITNLSLAQKKLRVSRKGLLEDFGDEGPEGPGGKSSLFRWGNRKGARRRKLQS